MPDPRTLALAALRIGIAMLMVAGVGWIAHLPLGQASSESALKLALRTPRAQIEVCRDATAEELAALPQHMRQARSCEITTIDYRLEVRVDDLARIDRTIAHHGIRRNRPLVVDELLMIEPGVHTVEITFAPIAASDLVAGASGLDRHHLSDRIDFPRGRIVIAALVDDQLRWVADPVTSEL